MSFKPKANALYLCDNGRCVCGQHLGTQARATGRDLSGQAVYCLQPKDHEIGTPPPRCEVCRATFGRSVKQGVVRPVLIRYKGKAATTVHDYASPEVS